MDAYRPRIADQMLAARLRRKGAVLIEGPKWCGKTTTAEQQATSVLYMSDPMRKQQNLQAAKINVQQLLAGSTPRLIDEWQIALLSRQERLGVRCRGTSKKRFLRTC